MKELVFTLLYQPLYNALMFLVWLIPGNGVGWAIILLTLIVRLILWPSTRKSLEAQSAMRKLQPKLKEVQEKYKDNKEKQTKAVMELYKENKVNPGAGCLTFLIQLPIIWVLYRVFTVGLDKSRFDILYDFLPRPEVVNTTFLGIDLSTPDRFILPLITAALQYWQMRQMQAFTNSATQPGKEDKATDMAMMMTKQMMLLGPVMTFIFAYSLPAALPLYWLVTTLLAVIQQWLYFRNTGNVLAATETGAGSIVAVGDAAKSDNQLMSASPLADLKGRLSELKNKLRRKSDVVVSVRRKDG